MRFESSKDYIDAKSAIQEANCVTPDSELDQA